MICCIFNIAPSYRKAIFTLLDKELNCHFYIGDKIRQPIKKMDITDLDGFIVELQNKYIFNDFYWQIGFQKVFKSEYKKYLVTGDLHCISNWIILFYSYIFNKKVYVWTHGWNGKDGWLKKSIKIFFIKLCTGVFLYGDYAKKIMMKSGIPERKLNVIFNSLDYEKQLEVRKKLKRTNVYRNIFRNDYPVIIFIGRIQKNKKLEEVILAMTEALKENIKLNFILIGGEIDSINLKTVIEENKMQENVLFYGSCFDEHKLGELIYNANVCVSPGHIGLTAIHSLMYGTPIITHDNVRMQTPEFEVVNSGFNGDLFEYQNISDLKNKILYWTHDVNFSLQIKENCYFKIDKYYNPKFQIRIIKEVLYDNISN